MSAYPFYSRENMHILEVGASSLAFSLYHLPEMELLRQGVLLIRLCTISHWCPNITQQLQPENSLDITC